MYKIIEIKQYLPILQRGKIRKGAKFAKGEMGMNQIKLHTMYSAQAIFNTCRLLNFTLCLGPLQKGLSEWDSGKIEAPDSLSDPFLLWQVSLSV
jgi:hypothetical protein